LLAALFCAFYLCQPGYAGDMALPGVASSYTGGNKSYLLALNADQSAATQSATIATIPASAAPFEPRTFTVSNAHKYFGLGTIVLAGLTAMAAPDEGCETNCGAQPPRQTSGTTHTRLARATATLAAATVTSGLLAHWGDVHLEDGLTDPDNLHAMLGATGALLMLGAIHKSANSATPTSHAGMAELGGVMMAVAIKLTW
jgi:hypothetical protein